MTKKEQVEIRKMIGKICDVCARINFETKYAASFQYQGAITTVSADVRDSKTDYGNAVLFEPYNYIFMGDQYSVIIKNLTDRLSALEKFLADELAK